MLILFFSFQAIGQNNQVNNNNIMETINTSGNNATGSSGSISYSIGQVFYTYIGDQSVYNVAQGIQHQELIKSLNVVDTIESKAEVFVFPNPTADFVNVNLKGFDLVTGQQSYQLYNLQGRLIKQNAIDQIQSQVSLNNLPPSIYILRIYVNNKVLNTFKIIKQ
jgi:hypothetical protein